MSFLRSLDNFAIEATGISDVMLISLVKKKESYDPVLKINCNSKTKVVIMNAEGKISRRAANFDAITTGCTVKARVKIRSVYTLADGRFGVSLFAKNIAVWPNDESSSSSDEWVPSASK